MELSLTLPISNIFGLTIKVSGKVTPVIQNHLAALLQEKHSFNEYKTDWTLSLFNMVNEGQSSFRIVDPKNINRIKYFEAGIWFPSTIFNTQQNHLPIYVENILLLLEKFFNETLIMGRSFAISKEDWSTIKLEVEKEVLDNPEYAY